MSLAFLKSALLMEMPGGIEWVLIILAVLVLFGGRKIPEFMRGLGKGIREFNSAKNNVKKEIEEGMNEEDEQEHEHGHVSQTATEDKKPSRPINPH